MQNTSASRLLFPMITFLLIAGFATTQPTSAAEIFTQKPAIEAAKSKTSVPAATKAEKKDLPKSHFNGGPTAKWLWAPQPVEFCLFNKRFDATAKAAHLIAACDNQMTVFINGKRAASSDTWEAAVKVDVTKMIVSGQNQILVEARNQGGPAGFVLKLVLTMADGTKKYVVTDKSWRVTTNKEATTWSAAVEIATRRSDLDRRDELQMSRCGCIARIARYQSALSTWRPTVLRRVVFRTRPGCRVRLRRKTADTASTTPPRYRWRGQSRTRC